MIHTSSPKLDNRIEELQYMSQRIKIVLTAIGGSNPVLARCD